MGIGRALVKLHVGALLFLAGYSFCNYLHKDKRYTLIRHDEVPYLLDKTRRERLPINEETFQVGSLEYRLAGVLVDEETRAMLKKWKYGGEAK